jgi:hypothetical protein
VVIPMASKDFSGSCPTRTNSLAPEHRKANLS